MHLNRPVLEARHHELISVCQRETFYLQPKYRDEKQPLWTALLVFKLDFVFDAAKLNVENFVGAKELNDQEIIKLAVFFFWYLNTKSAN